jgi:gluconate 2-dehydrogenase gamma chain
MEIAMSRNRKQTDNRSAYRAFAEAFASWRASPVSRRHFLQGMSAISAGMLLPLSSKAKSQSRTTATPQQAPWPTIAAVQQHLFPAEADSPGAHDINAAAYLKNLLDDAEHDQDERNFILNGPTWLNELAKTEYQKTFTQLNATQREQLLQRIARSDAGENWLSLLLLYIFEALLSSPIYGGNPDGIGWRWLEHNPGYPQPTSDNSYKKLLLR